MRPDRIPLFPLNVVLLPGAALPLHIFEPRYRAMIKVCLEQKSEFGILLSLPKGLARMGCTARILEVLNRQDDGSMDILTIGRAPFRVLQLITEAALLEGHVEYLEDRDCKASPAMHEELVELYETCHIIAGTLPLELGWKQQILESRSEADRQARLVAYLRDLAPHLEKAASIRQRAAGQGHGLN